MKSKARTDQTGEIFTPVELVNEMLDKLPTDVLTNSNKTVIDPACGNGQFLITIVQRRKCLKNIFGVDLMVDNVCDTIARLHFFKSGYADAFDHTGHSNCTVDLGHTDDVHPDYYWLLNNPKFQREYNFEKCNIIVALAKKRITNGLIFNCIDEHGIELYPTIVCANSLEFFKDGEKNGYDEIQKEIEIFNDNNCTEVISKIVEPETILSIPEELECINVIKEQKIVTPTIKNSKPVVKVHKKQNIKLIQKIHDLEISLEGMIRKNESSIIIERLRTQIAEAKLQL